MNSDVLLTDKAFSALKSGDKPAFKLVFDQYYALIKYVVCQCGVSNEDSNDIVQEVFFRFFKNVKKISHQNCIKAWLITSARNLAIDSIRKSKKNIPLENSESVELEDSSISSIKHEMELNLIGELLDKLALESGDSTLVEFYRLGMTAKQISEKNNEPISTVTNRLSRMRKKFSEYLKYHIEELRASAP